MVLCITSAEFFGFLRFLKVKPFFVNRPNLVGFGISMGFQLADSHKFLLSFEWRWVFRWVYTSVGKMRLVHLVRLRLVTYVTLTKSNT